MLGHGKINSKPIQEVAYYGTCSFMIHFDMPDQLLHTCTCRSSAFEWDSLEKIRVNFPNFHIPDICRVDGYISIRCPFPSDLLCSYPRQCMYIYVHNSGSKNLQKVVSSTCMWLVWCLSQYMHKLCYVMLCACT